MSNGRKLANLILGTEVKITNVDSDLANTISSLKTRLDSDDTKLQSLDTAVKAGFTNLADSEVIINQITAKISSVITNLDSDSVALQSVNTTIGLIKSRLDSDDAKVQAIGTELANEISATNTDITAIKGRLDSDDAKLQSLDTQIVLAKSRLDSDGTAIQTLAGLAAQARGAAGLSDSDLKVVADLRNDLDSEILSIRNLIMTYTNFIYNATAGQTSFTGSDANSATLAYTVGTIQVFLNGIKLDDADYTATDGTSIVLAEGALLGHQLTIIVPKIESYIAPPGYNWTTLAEQAKLVASDGGSSFSFGIQNQIKGDYVVVGCRGVDSGDGAGYVFKRTGTSWAQQAKLTNSSRNGQGDGLADAVDITRDGDYVVLGTQNYDHSGLNDPGGAFIYLRSGTSWSLQATLTASDAAADDRFGHGVAIDGTTAAIAAPKDSTGGSIYIFNRSGTSWSQAQKIEPSDVASNDGFGYELKIEGDYLVASSMEKNSNEGAAYVFYKSGGTWSQQAKLMASDNATGDLFGASVGISEDGNYIVVSSQNKNSQKGAAYVFKRSGTNWSQQAKLEASDATNGDQFGGSCAINEDGLAIVVGAVKEDGGGTDSGQSYLFSRSGTSWTESKIFKPSSSNSGDEFGRAVSINGNSTAVGARSIANSDPGFVAIFTV